MVRSELSKKLTESHGDLPCDLIDRIIKHIFELMIKSLMQGERIEIRGFGNFSLRYRASRLARNPKTRKIINIGEKNSIYFRTGKELNERINQN